MKVADGNLEKEPPKKAQRRISKVSVQKRHCLWGDSALESVSHHQISAAAQLIKVFIEAREIIAVVGIAHDDVAAASGLNPAKEGPAIAANGRVHQPRAVAPDDLPRPVGAAIVRDEDLTGHAFPGEERLRFSDACPDRLSLIEARHEDRQFEIGRPNEP